MAKRELWVWCHDHIIAVDGILDLNELDKESYNELVLLTAKYYCHLKMLKSVGVAMVGEKWTAEDERTYKMFKRSYLLFREQAAGALLGFNFDELYRQYVAKATVGAMDFNNLVSQCANESKETKS